MDEEGSNAVIALYATCHFFELVSIVPALRSAFGGSTLAT